MEKLVGDFGLRLFLGAGLSATLLACGPGVDVDAVDLALDGATPSYALHIKPLYEKHCVACHDGDGVKQGGVELDRYESAFATRTKSVCTAIAQDLVDAHGDRLLPFPANPSTAESMTPCGRWAVNSMPTGARSRLTRHEQVILLRWHLTGGSP